MRQQILSIRDAMPPAVREEKSEKILQTLYSMRLYQEAEIILTYVDYLSEVMTTPLLGRALSEGRQVFVPKVLGEEMEFYQILSPKDLKEGYRGIKEPAIGAAFLEEMEADKTVRKADRILMLIPGVVFDKQRHRIGYGKAFYDRYMKRLELSRIRPHTLALCFECQMLECIPYEAHDVRPEMVLTEDKLYQS